MCAFVYEAQCACVRASVATKIVLFFSPFFFLMKKSRLLRSTTILRNTLVMVLNTYPRSSILLSISFGNGGQRVIK